MELVKKCVHLPLFRQVEGSLSRPPGRAAGDVVEPTAWQTPSIASEPCKGF